MGGRRRVGTISIRPPPARNHGGLAALSTRQRRGFAMEAIGRTVSIGQSEFHCPCHACAFFNSRDEEYELLLPFAKDGYEAGDRMFQVVAKDHRDERRRRLATSGITLDKAESAGELEIRVLEEAYLRGNRFDQYAMLELAESVLREGRDKGFSVTRFWANMEWA